MYVGKYTTHGSYGYTRCIYISYTYIYIYPIANSAMNASCRWYDFRCSTHWKDISMALSPDSELHHWNSCPWKLKLWKTSSNLLDNSDVGSDVSHGMTSLEVFMKKNMSKLFFWNASKPQQNITTPHLSSNGCCSRTHQPNWESPCPMVSSYQLPGTQCWAGIGQWILSSIHDRWQPLHSCSLFVHLRHVTNLYRNLAWWNGTTHPYQRETPCDLAFCQLTSRAGGGCTMSLLLVNSFRRPIGSGSMF